MDTQKTKPLTREQVEKLVKENPQFAAELAKAQKEQALNGDSANSIKTYYNLRTARSELGLLELGKEGSVSAETIDTKNKPHLASGVISDKRFLFTTANKSEFLINFGDEIVENRDFGNIPNKENEASVYFINSNTPSELVRINIVYVNEEHIETVSHFEKKDCAILGKDKLLYTCELKTEAKEEGIKAHRHAFFNIDPVNNTIKVACDVNGLEDHPGKWIFIPIFVKKSMLDDIDETVNKTYNDSKNDIVLAFIGNVPEDASEETKTRYAKLTSFVESNLYGNPYVDKYVLVKAYQDKYIIPFKESDFSEENSNEIDEINITGFLFPRFGFENVHIDESEYTKNELGLPELSAKVKANLKVIGVSKDIMNEIISSGNMTVEQAKNEISVANKFLEDSKTKIYDAKCKLSLDIDTDNWIQSAYGYAEILIEEVGYNNSITEAEKFIKDTEMQLLSFINTSKRIQGKIDRGEFSNAYLLTCVSQFWEMYFRRLGNIVDGGLKPNLLSALYELINFYYIQGDDKDTMIERKNDVFLNTSANMNGAKDKHGNEYRSVASILSDHVNDIIDISDITDTIPEEEREDEIVTRLTARYEFIKAIATSPLSILYKLYPEIKAAINGKEVTDADKAVAEKYRSEIGFDNIDTDKYRILVESIVSSINVSRAEIEKDKGVRLAQLAVKNANEFAKKVGSKHVKGVKNKLETYIRSIVIIDNVNYLDPVATGYRAVAETEQLAPDAIVQYFYPANTNSLITVEEYEKLSDEEKKTCVKQVIVSDSDKVNIMLDYIVRTSLISSVCTILYKLFNDYSIKDSKLDSDKMFMSSLSLVVPSLQLLETVNLSKHESPFDPMSVIDGDKKVRFGSSAIKHSLGGIEDEATLRASRSEYILQCLKFVETSFVS